MFFSSVWYVIPLLLLEANMSTGALFQQWNWRNNRHWCVPLIISEWVLTRWWHLVAFMKTMNLLHGALHTLLYRCIAMAIETAIKVGTYYIVVLFAVNLAGGRRGNTERVVARWQRPVASGVALDMLHRVMPHVLLQRHRMAIKWAVTQVHLFVAAAFFARRKFS